MKRTIAISLCLVCVFLVYSCKPKLTCAAYHSCYILFPEHQDMRFSPFGEDSIPKGYTHNKDEHGLSIGPDPKTYKKRHYNIPMQNIYPLPSEKKKGDNEYDINDSLGVSTPDYSADIPTGSTSPPPNDEKDTPEGVTEESKETYDTTEEDYPEVIPGAEEDSEENVSPPDTTSY